MKKFLTCVELHVWEDHNHYDEAHPQDAAKLVALWKRWGQIRYVTTTLKIAQMMKQGEKLANLLADTIETAGHIAPYLKAEN